MCFSCCGAKRLKPSDQKSKTYPKSICHSLKVRIAPGSDPPFQLAQVAQAELVPSFTGLFSHLLEGHRSSLSQLAGSRTKIFHKSVLAY